MDMRTFLPGNLNRIVFTTLSAVGGLLFGAALATAATTISTSIDTAGNITTSAGNITATAGNGTFGGTLGVTGLSTLGSVAIGGGSTLSKVLDGTCNLTGMDTAQEASSTAPYDCAVTGIRSGDRVYVTLSTTTVQTTYLGWSFVNAYASSTDGYLTVVVRNSTGDAATPSTQKVGSSTQYLIIH